MASRTYWTVGRIRGTGVRRLGRAGRAGGADQVEQVAAFGVVELQRAGDGVQDALGDPGGVAAFEAGVVLHAHPGEHRDLDPAQPRHAAPPGRRQARLGGGDLGAPRHQELTDLGSVVHPPTLRAVRGAWGALPVHPSSGTPTRPRPVVP